LWQVIAGASAEKVKCNFALRTVFMRRPSAVRDRALGLPDAIGLFLLFLACFYI